MGLSFGRDRGPIRVYGLRAEHHCQVMVDGEVMGLLYGMEGGKFYEYRGKAIGLYGLEWVGANDGRVVVARLSESLVAEQNERTRNWANESWVRPECDPV